jgi:hypothetical protein
MNREKFISDLEWLIDFYKEQIESDKERSERLVNKYEGNVQAYEFLLRKINEGIYD